MSETYEFNGVRYVKDYESGLFTMEHNKTKPEEIFKFYSLSKNSVTALKQGYFYASHPIDLNDTLDSSKFLMFASKKLDIEFYYKLIGDALTKDEIIDLYNKDTNNEHLCSWYISNHYDTSTNLYGIISTTAKENNILMWPHYTQEMGFQIKFKTEKLEESIKSKLSGNEEYLGFYPINYTEKLMPIDISIFKAMFIPLFYITNVKSNKWAYEDEWRFLVGKQNMGVPYSKMGLSRAKDYFVQLENRFVYYDKSIVEEITVAQNFFNGRDFDIIKTDAKSFKVQVKENKSDQKEFLDYVVENLSDKLFHSGIKYENDEDGFVILVRTKEQLLIQKIENNTYLLTRTDNYKAFLD